MDRRDFIKGEAVTVAAIGTGGVTLNAVKANPLIVGPTARLNSITLPAAYIGRSFTIRNTGDIPIFVNGGPSEIILPPGGELIAPFHIVKFSSP